MLLGAAAHWHGHKDKDSHAKRLIYSLNLLSWEFCKRTVPEDDPVIRHLSLLYTAEVSKKASVRWRTEGIWSKIPRNTMAF